MRKLGIFSAIAEASTPFKDIANVRAGRIVDRTPNQHYGILYEEIVRVVRRNCHLPLLSSSTT